MIFANQPAQRRYTKFLFAIPSLVSLN